MAGTSPTVLRRRIASELRHLRERAGMSVDDACKHVDVSRSTMGRIERAETSVTVGNLLTLLRLYGVGDEDAAQLVELAKLARKRGWWQRYADAVPDWFSVYVGLETDAAAIREYEPQLIPGLLQTEDYARAIIEAANPNETAGQIDKRIGLRMSRQQPNTPPTLWLILDQAVLTRPVGGPGVMCAQLSRIIEATHDPGITVQVLPFATGEHASMGQTFTILTFDDARDSPVVYLENQVGGLYLDEGEPLARYSELFDHLQAQAAGVRESRDIMAKAVDNFSR